MNNSILFTIFAVLTILVGPVGVNIFAQNVTQHTNQTRDKTHVAMNETDETAGNITEGLGDAVNETGEALSNTAKGAIEGIQDVINGSSL